MIPLDEIALRHGTDKSSAIHGYAEFYDRILGHLRDAPCSILEFGILRGQSLRMWEDGFPKEIGRAHV